MNETDAKAALRALGIRNPSKQLVSDWLRMQQSQECALDLPDSANEAPEVTVAAQEPSSPGSVASANPAPPRPTGSRSNLRPTLLQRGELVREGGPRRAGRPQVRAIWFQALATRMADGTSLRTALASLGIYLSERDRRSLYRNRALTQMRQQARQEYLREWGLTRRSRTARPKGCRGADCLGLSEELRRIL